MIGLTTVLGHVNSGKSVDGVVGMSGMGFGWFVMMIVGKSW